MRTFGNVLFAVSLFVVWGVLTLIGVVVDQGQDPSSYLQAYAAPIARAILRLDFDNIYHSPWYVGIIGLILLSLAVCTFKRVIPARLPPLRPVNVEKIPLHATLRGRRRRRRRAATPRTNLFASRGWRIRERVFGGVEWSFADKHNWARRGVLVAHAGFVIIAAGTTLYWARGFSGEMAVLKGETAQVAQTHALIRLDDFAYRIAPIMTKSGMVYQPIDYVSRVTVTGNDGVPKQMTVRVNHPIDIDGTLYYQASYGFGMRFLVTRNGKRDAALSRPHVRRGRVVRRARNAAHRALRPLRADGRQAERDAHRRSARQRPGRRPRRHRRPAARSARRWCRCAPGSTSATAGASPPSATCSTAAFSTATIPAFRWSGSAPSCCSRGSMISFYLLPARIYLRVDEAGPNRSRVGAAATTVKGYDVFESEFSRLMVSL